MDIAGAILHSQNVSGLSHMRQNRIVRGIFTMVGIESPKRPTDAGACGNDAAVDIHSQSTQSLSFNGLTNDLTVDSTRA
jgi:hypothetical protein